MLGMSGILSLGNHQQTYFLKRRKRILKALPRGSLGIKEESCLSLRAGPLGRHTTRLFQGTFCFQKAEREGQVTLQHTFKNQSVSSECLEVVTWPLMVYLLSVYFTLISTGKG